jgi:hypothetical protein
MPEKTLEIHVREHAGLIEHLVTYRLDEFEKRFDKKWDAKLSAALANLEDGSMRNLRTSMTSS